MNFNVLIYNRQSYTIRLLYYFAKLKIGLLVFTDDKILNKGCGKRFLQIQKCGGLWFYPIKYILRINTFRYSTKVSEWSTSQTGHKLGTTGRETVSKRAFGSAAGWSVSHLIVGGLEGLSDRKLRRTLTARLILLPALRCFRS